MSTPAFPSPYPVTSPVTPFRDSGTDRSLRGALAESRIDPAFVLVCADDLERALHTIEAYERGAPVGLLRTPTWRPDPWWVRTLTDLLVTGMILGFVLAVLWLRGR